MTAKERTHRLVDELPESELEFAGRVLETLRLMADPLLRTLLNAPKEDEPISEEAVAEAYEDLAAGRVKLLEEGERELGL